VLDELPDYVHAAIVDVYIRAASHRGLRDEDAAALAAPWLTAEGKPAFYRQIEQTDEAYLAEIEERLERVEGPVRVVWGADDAWIDPDVGRRIADRIPSATFALVEGAGHLVQYDAPVALASEIRAWLSGRRPE
jgi:pimeloyl-ACP methyl ester carboxylesterase